MYTIILPLKFAIVFITLLCAQVIFATQEVSQDPTLISHVESQTEDHSPRIARQEILNAISEKSYDKLKETFNTQTSGILSTGDTELVIANFPALLDQYGSLLPAGVISNNSMGSQEQNIPSNMELLGNIKTNGETIRLLLERVELENNNIRWLISQETIYDLSKVAAITPTARINELLPIILLDNDYRGSPIGHWIAMAVISVLCICFAWLMAFAIRVLLGQQKRKKAMSKKGHIAFLFATPISLVSSVALFVWLERYLGVSILIRQYFSFFTISILWIALFIFIWSLLDRISAHTEQISRKQNRAGRLSLVIFFRASAKVILILVGFIIILDSNGVDVTTGLAALGIGGIALALGAQKAIENVVGSIIIVVDQPFRVGDFCKIGDVLGTIENIGLRSTRIRTLSDTLITFPNGALSSEQIENYTMRGKFLLRTTLNLRYETTTQDIENIVQAIKDNLQKIKFIDHDGLRVRFVAYNSASLDIEIFAYINAMNYPHFLERQESVLLGIGHIIEENNSGFAFPSQTLYITKDNYSKKADSGS